MKFHMLFKQSLLVVALAVGYGTAAKPVVVNSISDAIEIVKKNRPQVSDEEKAAVIELIKKAEAKTLNETVDYGKKTLLHWAVLKNRVSILDKLLEKDGIDVNVQEMTGRTPLHFAVQKSNEAAVEKLLDKNANHALQNNEGNTPLHVAAGKENTQIFQKLLPKFKEKDELELKNENGKTALHVALDANQPAHANSLLTAGADKTSISNDDKNNILVQTAMNPSYSNENKKETIEVLLKMKAYINATDPSGYTALHWAAEQGNSELVEFLLEQKKINVNTTGHGNKTPLHFAVETNDKKTADNKIKADAIASVVEKLIDAGALNPIPDEKLLRETIFTFYNLKSKIWQRTNPLEYALKASTITKLINKIKKDASEEQKEVIDSHLEAAKFFSRFYDTATPLTSKEYLKASKDPQALAQITDLDGFNLIHYALLTSETDFIEELIRNYKLHIDRQSNDGHTPLMTLSIIKRSDRTGSVFNFLINNGAKIDIKNKDNETPLHIIIHTGNRNDLLDMYLKIANNANIDETNKLRALKETVNALRTKNNLGKTPIELAKIYSNKLKQQKQLFEGISSKMEEFLKKVEESGGDDDGDTSTQTPLDNLASNLKTLQSSLNNLKNALGTLEK